MNLATFARIVGSPSRCADTSSGLAEPQGAPEDVFSASCHRGLEVRGALFRKFGAGLLIPVPQAHFRAGVIGHELLELLQVGAA